jgi:hypothetical protein
MGDQPTLADLMEKLTALTTDMSAMKVDLEGLKNISSPSETGGGSCHDGTRDLDRPPSFRN